MHTQADKARQLLQAAPQDNPITRALQKQLSEGHPPAEAAQLEVVRSSLPPNANADTALAYVRNHSRDGKIRESELVWLCQQLRSSQEYSAAFQLDQCTDVDGLAKRLHAMADINRDGLLEDSFISRRAYSVYTQKNNTGLERS